MSSISSNLYEENETNHIWSFGMLNYFEEITRLMNQT